MEEKETLKTHLGVIQEEDKGKKRFKIIEVSQESPYSEINKALKELTEVIELSYKFNMATDEKYSELIEKFSTLLTTSNHLTDEVIKKFTDYEERMKKMDSLIDKVIEINEKTMKTTNDIAEKFMKLEEYATSKLNINKETLREELNKFIDKGEK